MKELFLRKPELADEANYIDFLSDMGKEEDITPGQARLKGKSYQDFLTYLDDMSHGKCDPGLVPSTLYLLVDQTQYIYGALDFRHELNDYLLKYGGHFGYGIRISEQHKGYGKLILKLGLKLALEKGYDKIHITCDEDNLFSRKVILANQGVYEDRIFKRDDYIRRYWIDLKALSTYKKKLIFIQGDIKTHKTMTSYRLASDLSCPVVSYDEILETSADQTPVYHKDQLKELKKTTFELIKVMINRSLNHSDFMIFEGRIDEHEFNELESLLKEKQVEIITVTFYGNHIYLHEKYDDYYDDMHFVHKVSRRLSLSMIQNMNSNGGSRFDLSFNMDRFNESKYNEIKLQIADLLKK